MKNYLIAAALIIGLITLNGCIQSPTPALPPKDIPIPMQNGNPCTIDFCNQQQCQHTNAQDGTTCPEGTCQNGRCIAICNNDGKCNNGETIENCLKDCKEKTCSDLGGNICHEGQSCFGTWIDGASDSSRCCKGTCTLCSDGTCNGNENTEMCPQDCKINKSCFELGGDKCTENETCNQTWLDSNDSLKCCNTECTLKEKLVIIIIDSQINSQIRQEIETLKEDISKDLLANVEVYSKDWKNIQEIRELLKTKYLYNGLIGAIFIGDIPTAYFEYQNTYVTASDWYFQDLDGDSYIDSDGDGLFEREFFIGWTDKTMRDIWLGRIKPPVSGAEGIELLKDYFKRDHAYRTGNLTFDRKMLHFGSIEINQTKITLEEYLKLVNEIPAYTGFYESTDQIDYIYNSDLAQQKKDYLTKLSNSYDFIFVNIHGSSTTQWLGANTEVGYDEIKLAKPNSIFSVLASCSNGKFTDENYFAGWWLFSGKSLAVTANSTISMLVGAMEVNFLADYRPLNLGVSFGEMQKNESSFLVTHLFGDPTLKFRNEQILDIPRAILEYEKIEFNNTNLGEKSQKTLRIKNTGKEVLKIYFMKAPGSINGKTTTESNLDYWDFFYYEIPETGYTFRDFAIMPGETKEIPFFFYPRENSPSGQYSMTMYFQTNDPLKPFINLQLVGSTN
ncbi:MAG TPA: hypothetical protein HA222_05285 [Candidatus Diapherotrites archaeon]|uniref:Gingipain domain-containing protein n=1 Tax=Candidatus Iainarchaeum sp. TaxID=3101447 RepID=A0A7J4KZA8_9ARCH|nr:hypothetical protein [Candidatus Diapherotrites archaeon]HIH32676.1 hypothetical protein [Candidatus Diapherotrites archaeon]